MSRNFELLQEIGGDNELFGTLGPLPDAASVADEEPLSELDKEMREAILQNASLPGVVEASDEPIESNDVASAEQKSPMAVDSGPKSSLDFSLNEAFWGLSNLSSPTDFPTIFSDSDRSRNPQKVGRKSDGLPEVSRKDHVPRSLQPTANHEMPQIRVKPAPSVVWRKGPVGSRWIDTVKAATGSWRYKLREYRLQEAELQAIAREEESKLVQRVFPGTKQDSPRVALFSGLDNSSGSASVCAGAAQALAARGEGPVCVIDANFESPTLHQHFGTENAKGLAEAILETSPIRQYVREIEGPGLCFMPSGRTSLLLSAAEIADRFRTRIAEARTSFWYVVIHAGFLGLDSTAMMISRSTDGVVLVVEANRTRRESAKRVKENLLAANVSLLGVVLNNRTYPIPKVVYRML